MSKHLVINTFLDLDPRLPILPISRTEAQALICSAIDEMFGEKCSDFDARCATCAAWKEWESLTANPPAGATADAARREAVETERENIRIFLDRLRPTGHPPTWTDEQIIRNETLAQAIVALGARQP